MSDREGKRGLPGRVRMRHTRHFVDDLATSDAPPVGRMVPLSSIEPDPRQPRTGVGDLSALVASIRDKGVLEPILVRPNLEGHAAEGAAWLIVSGERRYRAALEAGLYEIPAIEMEVSEQEAMEIALVENLQREDLTPFEEAEGYRVLSEVHDYTHEEIARAVGKSRTVITESLALLRMPKRVRECTLALGIDNKSILLEVLKLDSEEAMLQLLERVSTLGMARDAVRREVRRSKQKRRAGPGTRRSKPYSFEFKSPERGYRLSLSFRRASVEPEDLIEALEDALEELRRQLQEGERL